MPNIVKKSELYSENIEIKGAKEHNLKNIDITVERDKFTVITGLSGSGKSSLAFDTLYAEGQRRYVESLSSYARQFLGRLHKPEVEYIKGIPPAIAVEQKVNTSNPRSTVGTSTEIYDYLKLLFARIGETFSPKSGKKVKRHSVTDVSNFLLSFPESTKAIILAPIHVISNRTCLEQLQVLLKQGFSRVEFDEKIEKIDELIKNESLKKPKSAFIVIDRISVSNDDDTIGRIGDSVQTAFYEGTGECLIKVFTKNELIKESFSNRFEADGIKFEIPTVHTFSFNNPLGACPVCEGFGKTMGIDEDLVIPNKTLSIYEEAVACWKGEKMSWYKDQFINVAHKFDFPVHKPYRQLSPKQKEVLWEGNEYYNGLYSFFKMIEKKSRKIQYRVMLSRYRGKTTCYHCKGTRLKKEASYVKINKKSISDLVNISIVELKAFFESIKLSEHQLKTGERLLAEIKNRIQYLDDVGLSYLTLNRLSSTLSGGESQRINLSSSLGSSLVGSLYILDEPSIGLHSKDTGLLIKVLKQLRDIGNTVIVVEHDEEIIKKSDRIIDIGPFAGTEGGEIVFEGTYNEILKNEDTQNNSLTVKYLKGKMSVPLPEKRRISNNYIKLTGASHNNLKAIDVSFPLNVMTVVTGVSGSGKSSLVRDILFLALSREINDYGKKPGSYASIEGDLKLIDEIEFVNQNPIGKSSRSNPVTYIKAFDEIRKLFAIQQNAKINGFKPGHFSFNVDGGRCETCRGEGEIRIEMQFMADVHLECEECKGKRFKDEVLDVEYKAKNIYDILELTVDEAYIFFSENNETKKISDLIRPLADVGLGYVKLGQSSNTLSGGESQRIKLASFLSKEKSFKKTMFIFDEPTTGLHFHDINKLLKSFNALLDRGHTIVIIEHNLEVIKSADYIIDLGPEGGDKGGYLLFEGSPEDLVNCKESYTAKYLKEKLH
ncbi:MAG: excinuclease ABC subunit UvrA [Bacteroidales bacterium]|nr:excinuclease ABC subunit UvrA [Bacteroidales bacterium]